MTQYSKTHKIYSFLANNWLIVGIFITAFFLRVYKLQRPLLFCDEPSEIMEFLRLQKTSLFKLSPLAGNFFAQIFSYVQGPVKLLIGFFWSYLSSFLKIPLTEANLFMPSALFGSFSVIMLYLVGKNLFNKSIGYLAAALLAVSPLSVMLSRSIYWMIYAVFFQLATLLVFYKYFLNGKKGYAILGSILLALEIGCNNAFPLTLLILISLGVLTIKSGFLKENIWGRLKRVAGLLFKKEIILLPLLVILALSGASFLVLVTKKTAAFFQHLSSRPWQVGFHGANVWKGIVYVSGPYLPLLMVLIILFNIKDIWRDKLKIFLSLWILIYAIPFLFLITNIESPHLLFIASPVFLLLSATLVSGRGVFLKFVSILSILIFLIGFGLLTLGNIFNSDPLGLGFFREEYPGAVDRGASNRGFKTAGFYIREYTDPKSKVFVPGEAYEIRFVAEFYLGKQILPGRFNNKTLYLTRAELQDTLADYYLMLEDAKILDLNKRRVKEEIIKYMKDRHLYKVAEIYDGAELLMTIHSPKYKPCMKLDIKKFDRKFDLRYANIKDLTVSFYQGDFEP